MGNARNICTLPAGLCGFLAVAMGAAAAHKAQDTYAAELLRLASFYQLIHSGVILTLRNETTHLARIACILFLAGILLFCGGLCAKAFEITGAGIFIPYGGGALMLGWLAVAGSAFKPRADHGA